MRVWESDLDEGDLVQTADGMLHCVCGVELFVTIKPIAPTDAEMIMLTADNVERPALPR